MAATDILVARPTTAGQIPGTAFAGVDLVDSIVRNDNPVGVSFPSFSEVELPTGKYILRAQMVLVDTSSGRTQTEMRWAVTSGTTALFYTDYETGYSRDASEDTHGCTVFAVVEVTSATAIVQIQWRRDSDPPTGGLRLVGSQLEVFEVDWAEAAHFTQSSTGQSYGGTTLNQVNLGTTVTASSAFSRVGNVVTIAGDTTSHRYLVLGTLRGDGATDRTQRNVRLTYGGSISENSPEANFYARNSSNSRGSVGLTDVVEVDATDGTVEIEAYRGAGVGNDQGGANVDGGWTADGAELCIVQIPDYVELIRTHDSTGLQVISNVSTVDLNFARNVDISTSLWSASGIVGFNNFVAADALACANIWSARQTVSSGARNTSRAAWKVSTVVQPYTEGWHYNRGNQGSTDTYGSSIRASGLLELTAFSDTRLEANRIPGGKGGPVRTQPDSVTAFAISIDTWTAIPVGAVGADGTPASAGWGAQTATTALQAPATSTGTPASAGWDTVAATTALVTPSAGTPFVIERITVLEGSNSLVQSFTPLTGLTDRAWLILIGHADANSMGRTGVNVRYNNADTSPGLVAGSRAIARDGSFPWNLVQTETWFANDAFIAAQAASANLEFQNVGQHFIAVVLELSDASQAGPDAVSTDTTGTAGATATAIGTTVTGGGGAVDMDHTFATSKATISGLSLASVADVAHSVLDIVAHDVETGITTDPSQLVIATQTRTGTGVLEITVSREETSAPPGATGADGTPASAGWGTQAATTALGASGADGSPASAGWGTQAATTALGASGADATPASTGWGAQAATTALGVTGADATPASAGWGTVAATTALGASGADATPASAGWAAQTATTALGAVGAADGAPASAGWGVQAATTALGAVGADAAPASAGWDTVAATTALPTVGAGATPASAGWGAQAATTALGVVRTADATPASAGWGTAPATTALLLTGAPGVPASAGWGTAPATTALGAVGVALGQVASAGWGTAPATTALLTLPSADGTPASAGWGTVAATTTLGAAGTADGAPASTGWGTADASTALGLSTANATPASAGWGAQAATTALGTSGADGVAASAGWGTADATTFLQVLSADTEAIRVGVARGVYRTSPVETLVRVGARRAIYRIQTGSGETMALRWRQGTFGHVIEAGRWKDRDGNVRDMTGQTVIARVYPPFGAAPVDRVAAVGLADGYVQYVTVAADTAEPGEWEIVLFQSDANENLDSRVIRYTVYPDEAGAG